VYVVGACLADRATDKLSYGIYAQAGPANGRRGCPIAL
jgi:hypothetical protein